MVLDKEEHRQAFLELIANAQFPGSAVHKVMELVNAVQSATVAGAGGTENDA